MSWAGQTAAFVVLGMLAATGPADAATTTLVSGSTLGFYNNQLGDLGAPSGLLPWFPAPNTFGGSTQVFSTAPDLSGAAASLGNWLTDPGNLNSNWAGPQIIPSTWTTNDEVAAVYTVDAGPGLSNVTGNFQRIDNGIEIWVDGAWKFGARDPLGTAWNNIPLGDLGPGTHYIQILLEDSGGGTAYQGPSITATVVPVPPAVWLFGTGLLGLMGCAKRHRNRERPYARCGRRQRNARARSIVAAPGRLPDQA